MIETILSDHVQDFIRKHEHDDPAQILLRSHDFSSELIKEIAVQIHGRQKAKKKLPLFYKTRGIVFPPSISLEQCSSEVTAEYKAGLIQKESTLADLTGGFGVDSYFFSQEAKSVGYFEIQPELAKLAQHNFQQLGADNIQCFAATGDEILQGTNIYNYVYLDPARRSADKRVFRLEDCQPDILSLQSSLLERAETLILKASPLLDISSAIKQLKWVQEVHVIAVQNDCKELLFFLKNAEAANVDVHAINFQSDGSTQEFGFGWNDQRKSISLANPTKYLYEPNAAILKSGGYDTLAVELRLSKLHPNSHLYTSEKLITDFPGRSFEIKAISKFSKKEIKQSLKGDKANITVRNFPASVAEIRKKLGLKEGGDNYLFATTDLENRKIVLICHKTS